MKVTANVMIFEVQVPGPIYVWDPSWVITVPAGALAPNNA